LKSGISILFLNVFALNYIIMSLPALPFKHLFGLQTGRRDPVNKETVAIKMCFILKPSSPYLWIWAKKLQKIYLYQRSWFRSFSAILSTGSQLLGVRPGKKRDRKKREFFPARHRDG
jgi:hypothetical protein